MALAIVLSISISQGVSHLSLISENNNGDSCNTPGCITAAHTLIQNMDPSADPCEDFYQYACGGFEERVRIPDDQSSRSGSFNKTPFLYPFQNPFKTPCKTPLKTS